MGWVSWPTSALVRASRLPTSSDSPSPVQFAAAGIEKTSAAKKLKLRWDIFSSR
jgi:hypothetical protein